MRVRQQDATKPARVVSRGGELICGRPATLIPRCCREWQRQILHLRIDIAAETGVDEQIAVRMTEKHGGHREVARFE